jgi:hypothetical protein
VPLCNLSGLAVGWHVLRPVARVWLAAVLLVTKYMHAVCVRFIWLCEVLRLCCSCVPAARVGLCGVLLCSSGVQQQQHGHCLYCTFRDCLVCMSVHLTKHHCMFPCQIVPSRRFTCVCIFVGFVQCAQPAMTAVCPCSSTAVFDRAERISTLQRCLVACGQTHSCLQRMLCCPCTSYEMLARQLPFCVTFAVCPTEMLSL